MHVHSHSSESPQLSADMLVHLVDTSPWLAALFVCGPAIPMLVRGHFVGAAVCTLLGLATIPAVLFMGPVGLLPLALACVLSFLTRARDMWARVEASRQRMFPLARLRGSAS